MCQVTMKRFFGELIIWIDCNLERKLSISDISIKSGYSSRYIQSIFMEELQVPLGTFVRRKKMISAASDLECSNEKIIDISLKYGFSCQQTFTRAFKKEFLLTPGKYRELCGVKVSKP